MSFKKKAGRYNIPFVKQYRTARTVSAEEAWHAARRPGVYPHFKKPRLLFGSPCRGDGRQPRCPRAVGTAGNHYIATATATETTATHPAAMGDGCSDNLRSSRSSHRAILALTRPSRSASFRTPRWTPSQPCNIGGERTGLLRRA